MDAIGHRAHGVDVAASIVNALTHGQRRGRAFAAPVGHERRAAVTAALESRPFRAASWEAADDRQLDAVTADAGRWRRVFEAAAAGADAVAPWINLLLRDAPVQPVLVDHDGEPWHLHAHSSEADRDEALAATVALALARFVADGDVERLGVCSAEGCDRVFVDTTRNMSRQYCSSACRARTTTAAFRARRS